MDRLGSLAVRTPAMLNGLNFPGAVRVALRQHAGRGQLPMGEMCLCRRRDGERSDDMPQPTGKWRVASASVRGSGHERVGMPCQDANCWTIIERTAYSR